MPMQDLSQTTLTLQRLLQFNIPLLAPDLGAVTVSTLPPERVTGASNVLSLYCYHVSPDVSNRLRPAQPSGPRPIATSPLTLNLNYILTAHTVEDTEFNALAEQRLLGYAMKTLHDYPTLDDSTQIAGNPVFPDEIRGQQNRFRVIQLQLTAGEALNYWANEHDITVKPSCYYEVTAADLAPEPPDRLSGVVLQLGAFVMPKDTPVISSSTSDVHFTRPSGDPASLTATPARVGPVTAAPPPVNVLTLNGRGFTNGTAQRLILSHPFWSRQFPGGRVPVNLTLNAAPDWDLTVAQDSVTATLGDTLRATPPSGGAPVDLALYPGQYLAIWEVDRTFDRDGVTETITDRSNGCSFAMTPRITAMARDNGTGAVTLDLGGDWLLTRGRPLPADPLAEPELDLMLAVDGQTYTLVTSAPAAGEYTITDRTLTYLPLPVHDTPGNRAIRLVVDGADAQPFWVAVP